MKLKSFIEWCKETFTTVISLHWWLRNEPTSEIADSTVKYILDNSSEFSFKLTPYRMIVNKKDKHICDIWITNYPYSYGQLYNPEQDGLPSRATSRRLRKFEMEMRLREFKDRL